MKIAEQERKRLERYRLQLPDIVAGLREQREPVALAEELTGTSDDIDQWEVYRWVQATESRIEQYRRRRAIILLIPVWIGGIMVVAGGLLLVIGAGGVEPSGLAAVILSVGALLGGGFLYAAVRKNRHVHQQWLQQELRDHERPDR